VYYKISGQLPYGLLLRQID